MAEYNIADNGEAGQAQLSGQFGGKYDHPPVDEDTDKTLPILHVANHSSELRCPQWAAVNSTDLSYLQMVHDNDTLCPVPPSATQLPREMRFNDDSLMAVVVYCMLFVIAAFGNLTVFITLFRNRHRKSRVNLFIMHLSLADLIVTFIMLPLETIWHITVSWNAGDVACRLLMFFRAFGLYLSSFILVTISLDRYFAILHPLSMNDSDKRSKLMLTLAWLFSGVASLPQSVIFHIEYHPDYAWFAQCVTFNFFPTPAHELAYNLFNIITVYGLPLLVIIISYTIILCEITKKTRESKEDTRKDGEHIKKGRERLRRSGVGKIERARTRTLKMTVMIVFVFVMCWTPYFVISAWWWFDKDSAARVNPKVQRGLFMFAVSNSCMDPIVYGLFSLDLKRELTRCCRCLRAYGRRNGDPLTSQSRVMRQSFHQTRTSSIKSTMSNSPMQRGNIQYVACTTKRVGNGTETVPLSAPQHIGMREQDACPSRHTRDKNCTKKCSLL